VPYQVAMGTVACLRPALAAVSSAVIPARSLKAGYATVVRSSRCGRRADRASPLAVRAARGGAAAKAAAAAAAAAAARQELVVSQLFAASTVYTVAVAALVSSAHSPTVC
jgi:hypothetical protein